jgi:hypothetical protein
MQGSPLALALAMDDRGRVQDAINHIVDSVFLKNTVTMWAMAVLSLDATVYHAHKRTIHTFFRLFNSQVQVVQHINSINTKNEETKTSIGF